jgi:hypothetical protein
MFFAAHKPQPQFLSNMYLNPTNHIFFKPIFFQIITMKTI